MSLSRTIINANEGGDIESIVENGNLVLLYNLKPIITVSANPPPTIDWTLQNTVEIRSGETVVQTIQADDADDAQSVRVIIRDFFEMASVEE